jgi:hypothetical protein
MQSVSYKRKVDNQFFPELLVMHYALNTPQTMNNVLHNNCHKEKVMKKSVDIALLVKIRIADLTSTKQEY